MQVKSPNGESTIDTLLADTVALPWDDLERRPFERGDVLIREGDEWPGLDLLAAGRAVLVRGCHAHEQVLGVLHRGDALDVAPLVLAAERCWFTVRAVEPGYLYRLSAEQACCLAAQSPAFQRFIGRALAAQLGRLAQLVHDLAFKDVAERVSSWLYDEVAALEPVHNGEVVVPRDLSLRELASLLGTAREVVSRTLSRLARSGVIRLEPGRIVVTDRAQLEALAHRT